MLTCQSSGVNIINVFRACLLYEILVPRTTKLAFGFEILASKNFVQKICAKNVDEIDTRKLYLSHCLFRISKKSFTPTYKIIGAVNLKVKTVLDRETKVIQNKLVWKV
jgi:hypothetical protein